VTDRLAAEGINLPTYVDLADADIDRICAAIREAARP
jgi:dTDP-4-amino-4,6-dideoxygalactose transaminase